MDESLGLIAGFIAIVVGIFGAIWRTLQFLAGLNWIFSRSYREKVAKEKWYYRWMIYEGVFYVVVVVSLASLLLVGIALAPERKEPIQPPETTRGE
jgi:cbb3-type cytochrome oxidase subunit 3